MSPGDWRARAKRGLVDPSGYSAEEAAKACPIEASGDYDCCVGRCQWTCEVLLEVAALEDLDNVPTPQGWVRIT